MSKKITNVVSTILGNLYQNSILRMKNKNWEGHVYPYRDNIFIKKKIDEISLNNKDEMITLEVQDFITPVKFNNIIAIGKNFKNDSSDADLQNFKLNPDFFTMNTNAILENHKTTYLPYFYDSVLIEPEIGVVIKKECKNIDKKNIKNYISGYIICNDLSGRDLKGLIKDNTVLRKSSDGFLPVSSALVPFHKKSFNLNTFVNGKLIQSFDTDNLILKIDDAISFLSKHITLNENDLVCTGSAMPKPKVKSGDRIEIKVEGMGDLVTDIL